MKDAAARSFPFVHFIYNWKIVEADPQHRIDGQAAACYTFSQLNLSYHRRWLWILH